MEQTELFGPAALWWLTSVECKDMWEWVCFLVLGVSASVNQSKQLGSDVRWVTADDYNENRGAQTAED